MEQGGLLEAILVGGLLIIVYMVFFRGGIKAAMEKSRNAEADWKGVLIPIGGVVLFVILLVIISKR